MSINPLTRPIPNSLIEFYGEEQRKRSGTILYFLQGANMKLPIELIPNTSPPRFKWKQLLSDGRMVIHEGSLPPNLEGAISRLIGMMEDRIEDVIRLRKQIEGLCDRVVAQSEVIAKHAEKSPQQPTSQSPTHPPKKGK